MDNVGIEVGFGTPYDMSNFFALANTGGLGGLMYHNLAMGPTNTQTAKQAIYDPYNLGTNQALSAWYNYDQTPNMITTFTLTNSNPNSYIVVVTLYIYDPASTVSTQFYNANVSNGTPVTETDYDTGFNITTASLGNGLYEIWCDVSAIYLGPTPPGPGVLNNTTVASDTDGVGPGTTRIDNDIPNFDENNPLSNIAIVQGNISGTGIYANKRTTFTLTFN